MDSAARQFKPVEESDDIHVEVAEVEDAQPAAVQEFTGDPIKLIRKEKDHILLSIGIYQVLLKSRENGGTILIMAPSGEADDYRLVFTKECVKLEQVRNGFR